MAMHSRQSLPPVTWARSPDQPRLVAAGEDWDAVRVEADIGLRAVRFLEASSTPVGPVLHDQAGRLAYFLTPPGTARTWRQKRTRALGAGSWVVLVPPGREEGPLRWVSDPTDGPAHTAVGALAAALTVAAHEEVAGREVNR